MTLDQLADRQDIVRDVIDEHSPIFKTRKAACIGCGEHSGEVNDPRYWYSMHVAAVIEKRLTEAGL